MLRKEKGGEREKERARPRAHSHVVTVPDNWLGSRERDPRLRFRRPAAGLSTLTLSEHRYLNIFGNDLSSLSFFPTQFAASPWKPR